ncbi:MAG: uracil-DNA glycosylase, partial [Bacteroidota bacterium]
MNVIAEIEELIRLERTLFGDTLLVEAASSKEDDVTRRPKPAGADDPSLFDVSQSGKPAITTEPWGTTETLEELNAQICSCLKCPLGETRTNFVFGVGNPHATLLIVGEAPGVDEDAQGEPFVGRAGQLLNKILAAIGFRREDVYICNILKCRPPGNRKPAEDEVSHCIPYLKKQIEIIKPKLILCLGLTAAENLLKMSESLTKLRGRLLEYEGTPLMVTYHPA